MRRQSSGMSVSTRGRRMAIYIVLVISLGVYISLLETSAAISFGVAEGFTSF